MTDEHERLDDPLAGAFRSVREQYDGTNAEANLTLQRALLRTRRERRTRLTRWAVLPIAAVLVASTAWAGMTGRLGPTVHAMLDTFRSTNDSSAPSPTATSSTALAPIPAPLPAEPPTPDPVTIAEPPSPVTPPPPPAPRATTSLSSPSGAGPGERAVAAAATADTKPAETKPEAKPEDPQAALFAEAHRLHFTDRDPARALVAWDRYLAAAPNGRLVPEARYNRALTLVRLGRRAEAQQELSAFASGTYGDYRRDEAKALLGAFARDAAPSP